MEIIYTVLAVVIGLAVFLGLPILLLLKLMGVGPFNKKKGDAKLICTECGTKGHGKTITKGSMGVEIVLWLCMLIPGLIYSAWRMSSRYEACEVCGGKLIPLESPAGKNLEKKFKD